MRSYKHLPARLKDDSADFFLTVRSLSYDDIRDWCEWNFGADICKMSVHDIVNFFVNQFGCIRRSEYYDLCEYLDFRGVVRW